MTHQYFTAAAVGSELSRCSNCRHLFTYPRGHCSQCGSLSITSEPIRDRGTVYAVTVVRAHPNPEFNAMAPYAVAYVDLDLGGRVLTRLTTLTQRRSESATASKWALPPPYLRRMTGRRTRPRRSRRSVPQLRKSR